MNTLLIKNIKELLQIRSERTTKLSGKEMRSLPTIKDAWLYVKNGKIEDYGRMNDWPGIDVDEEIDATGKMLLPSWIDSHTHLVYAGNREQEFVDRINGLTYQEIAERGGGIPNSAKTLQDTPEDQLYQQSETRLKEIMKLGTGAVEIKSGYGLTTKAELKMLRVIQKLKTNYPTAIKSTFLGLHALPPEYKGKRDIFVDKVIEEMLPKVVEEDLADYIDIFCEDGYFTVEDTQKILEAGQEYGLPGKIHVNQFNAIGGVRTGVEYHARSVDHLEIMDDDDIEILKDTETMPVALPSCSFFIGIPYSPARAIIDAGLPLALATDYNPGSSPSGNMNLGLSLACIKMNMTPEEAINASTVNAAYAMDLSNTHGSITKGKTANLLLTKPVPSYGFLPYSFGSNNIDQVFIGGKKLEEI